MSVNKGDANLEAHPDLLDLDVLEPKKPKAPIPIKLSALLIFITAAEGLSLSFYNTFNALMVQYQFGIEADQVGYYVGYITSAFYLGQIFSNLPLGTLADRIGRKPMIAISLLANVISQILFGVSGSLWWAIVIRFFNGLLDCCFPVCKCIIRDISDPSNQARIFSFRTLGYALGGVMGPLISGIFSRPAENRLLSDTFLGSSSFFQTFPYALPCFIAAAINLFAVLVWLCFMSETKGIDLYSNSSYVALEVPLDTIEIELEQQSTNTLEDLAGDLLSNDVPSLSLEDDFELSFKPNVGFVSKFKNAFSFVNQGVGVSIFVYFAGSLIVMMVTQTWPVWASRDTDSQGLGFEEFQLGLINSVGAGTSVVFQTIAFSPLDAKLGAINSYRIGSCTFFVVKRFFMSTML